jgi:2-polyprenyl-3-methyl-5-hydroxy-6-metoxy-1,4-benzoquinol methylase
VTPSDYFRHERREIAALLEANGPVLDVGCGVGLVCESLARQGVRVVGVELSPEAAREAALRYDDVFVGPLESFDTLERFKQVVLADVLEHMVDPWAALRHVVDDLLEPGGRVIVSLPNVRHWRVIASLMLQGRWRYVDEGILDRTHLRFFTAVEARLLLAGAGLTPEWESFHVGDRVARLLPGWLHQRFGGLLAYQLIFVARPRAIGAADG